MNGANVMASVGAFILVAVIGWYGFLALDTVGLTPEHGTAVIVARQYVPAEETYVTQVINNRPRPIPQLKPEAFVLQLQIEGTSAEAQVSKQTYEAATPGQKIGVTFERGRMTGTIQIIQVRTGGN